MRPNAETVRQITESTVLPISIVTVFISIAIWVSELKATAEQSVRDITRVEQAQKDYLKTVSRIDERLSRIEGYVGRPYRK